MWEQKPTKIYGSANNQAAWGYRRLAVSTVVNHLAQCTFVAADVRDLARNDHANTLASSPRCARYYDPPSTTSSSSSQVTHHSTHTCTAHPYLTPQTPSPHPSGASSDLFSLVAGPSGSSGFPSVFISSHHTYLNRSSSSASFEDPLSPHPSLRPEDSMSAMSSCRASRVSSAAHFVGDVPPVPVPGCNFVPYYNMALWTSECQCHFEDCVGCLAASANLPHAFVDNTEWLLFCEEFIPGVSVFS